MSRQLDVDALFLIAVLTLAAWPHIRSLPRPRKRGTLLRPRWKRHNDRNDYDHYEDGGAA